jgi:periplasmic protein CpxP/Spy
MRSSIARHLFSALGLILAGAALAVAQGPGPGGMGPGFAVHRPPVERAFGQNVFIAGRWWNNPRMIDQLKLSDDQRKAMDEILFAHREKLIDLRANLEKAELAMQPLMSADQPDRKAMEDQINKVVEARADLERANSLFLLDIRMKLTPAQWKQLQDMRAAMKDRRGPGMQPWRGPARGPQPQTPPAQPPAPGQQQ